MDKKAYWIGLHQVPGLGPKRFQLLLDRFKHPKEVWHARESHLAEVMGKNSSVFKNLLECRQSLDLTAVCTELERRGVTVLTLEDPAYPSSLRNIYDPPPVLYVLGSLEEVDSLALAMVGSRRATPYGKAVAERLAGQLAQKGFTIVSGLARGIDTAGHRGALKAKGRTVAVLGCGVDIVYPRENKHLFEQITNNGAVISEFPLGSPPIPLNFPARNRIISGLSLGVVVVEAAENGGALITTDFALEQGRDVFAVPGPITSQYSRGTNNLIKEGARLVQGVEDVIEEYLSRFPTLLGNPPQQVSWQSLEGFGEENPRVSSKIEDTALNSEEKILLQLISLEPISIENLIAESGLTPSRVNSILMILEMKGLVNQLPGRCYIRQEKIIKGKGFTRRRFGIS